MTARGGAARAARWARAVLTGERQRRERPMDKFKDECGIFGIFGHPEAASLTSLGLYALQHRGQESAGIATADGERMRLARGMGQVADAFKEETLERPARPSRDWPHPVLDGGQEHARERAAVPDRLRSRADRGRVTTATSSTPESCATISSAPDRFSRRPATPRSSCISMPGRRRRRSRKRWSNRFDRSAARSRWCS